MKSLVVVLGATGVGKTSVSIRLARDLGCGVVNADSRQCFREMRIGTAYPSEEELAVAPHHLLGHRSVDERYSCGQYEQDALAVLEELFERSDSAVLCGGSMLYVDAVCRGMDDLPEPDPTLRHSLSERLAAEGVDALGAELARLDPTTWERIDRQNGARVLRALEVCLQTGKPYSSWLGRPKPERPFRVVKVGISRDWEELCARINSRVEIMLEAGLEAEARGLWAYEGNPALRTVGYTEFFSYFAGRISRDAAVERIRINTRRYAKRQLRWWARDDEIRWFDADDYAGLQAYVASQLVAQEN
ncbi:MAG: tRNA (adenosine(37)-N6)-dimethylallyltransferase MiaA [Bacteroidetes bacterium]|nr:MAG: tRNA (adenosine(37)-N6)-dimethylallyltransferase MiaA [Bacteroidota bacterium]